MNEITPQLLPHRPIQLSSQHAESNRLLCHHEGVLHRDFVRRNEKEFWQSLWTDRERERWYAYDLAKKTDKTKNENQNQNQNQNQNSEDHFRRQTYLSSSDYLCEVYEHLPRFQKFNSRIMSPIDNPDYHFTTDRMMFKNTSRKALKPNENKT